MLTRRPNDLILSNSLTCAVRALRESVAQIRTQLEIAVAKTKEKHAVPEEEASQ
jgi:hypothetical protein